MLPQLLSSATCYEVHHSNENHFPPPGELGLVALERWNRVARDPEYADPIPAVRRDHVVGDFLNLIVGMGITNDNFSTVHRWLFAGEPGIGLGPTISVAEHFWITLVTKHTAWQIGESGGAMPRQNGVVVHCTECHGALAPGGSAVRCNYLTPDFFHTMGVILAICFARQIPIPVAFSRALTRYLTMGKLNVFTDVGDFDSSIVESARNMMGESKFETFGCTWGELRPAHAGVLITNETRDAYIEAKVVHDVWESREPWLMSFRGGFRMFGHVREQLAYLSTEEVHSIVGGKAVVSFAELWAHMRFDSSFGAAAAQRLQHPTRIVLRGALLALDEAELSAVVKWCTGSSMIPAHSIPPFSIQVQVRADGGPNVWPKARTCFKTLILPLYTDSSPASTAEMLSKIRYVLRNRMDYTFA